MLPNTILSGGEIEFPVGVTNIEEPIVLPDFSRKRLKGHPGSIIRKQFHGDAIDLGKTCEIDGLQIDSYGKKYEGRGVVIRGGEIDQTSRRRITNCEIINSQGPGVEFIGDSAGYLSEISHCLIVPWNNYEIPAVKMPTLGEAETHGNRKLTRIDSLSNILCDFGDCDNAQMIGCDGGTPIFGEHCQKITMSGNRFVTVNNVPFQPRGIAHSMGDGTINVGGGVIFGDDLHQFRFGHGVSIGSGISITDNAPGLAQGNEIYYRETPYTPTWSGNVVDLNAVGLRGRFQRQGVRVWHKLLLEIRADTVFPGGTWYFSPYKPVADAAIGHGSAMIAGVYHDNIGVYLGFSALGTGIVPMLNGQPLDSTLGWQAGDFLMLDVWAEV
jgi:hypothetical protein